MKKINIQNEANIKAEGQFNSKRCKPVICVDNGKVFTSMLDAAEYAGVANPSMVAHLQGKTRSCGGKHFCYLSRVTESLDAIVTRLRETAEVEADAKKWRAYQAEQEKARKEEEDRLAKIAQAEALVAKLQGDCVKYRDKMNEAMNALNEAEIALESLRNGNANNEAA